MIVDDLTFGTDVRGDYALFIEALHILPDGWNLDKATIKTAGNGPTFFRIIGEGHQKPSHGWIENGKIIQWG